LGCLQASFDIANARVIRFSYVTFTGKLMVGLFHRS
jgi:hypothetical protein